MDTFSHAAWGYVALRWKGSRWAWLGVAAGAAPDLLYFVPYMVGRIRRAGWAAVVSFPEAGVWRADGPPLPPDLVEAYHDYYVFTHSLVILSLVAAVVALAGRRSWVWLLAPCLLHILMDIPTHERYLTPVFFPLWDWKFQGLSWSDPRIFWANLAALILVLGWIHRRTRDHPGRNPPMRG